MLRRTVVPITRRLVAASLPLVALAPSLVHAAPAPGFTAKDIDGKQIVLIRQASNTGQLYGSVSVRDIVEALEADGVKLLKNQVVLDKPIKAIGVSTVKVALHPEVSVTVTVNVARSPEEAELQAKGVDVMAEMFEKDEAGFVEAYDPNAEPGATAEVQAEPEGEAEA